MQSPAHTALFSKIVFLWLLILPAAGIWYSVRVAAEPVNVVAWPQAPRPDLPTLVMSTIQNPTGEEVTVRYRFYVDGRLLAEGAASLTGASAKTFQYIRKPSLGVGERVSFMLEGTAVGQDFQRMLSLPSYPPEIWSSFVSFATFSTSVMSSLVTMSYYSTSFAAEHTANLGFAMLLVLLVVQVFLEMTMPLAQDEGPGRPWRGIAARLVLLRVSFWRLAAILFMIFLGMVFTRVGLVFGVITLPG